VALLGVSFPLFACLGLTYESRARSAPLVDSLDELCLSGAVAAPIAARFLRACSWQMHDISVPVHHDFALRAVQAFRTCGDVRGLYETLYVQAIPFQTFLADAQSALADMQAIERPEWPRTVRALACIARSRVANGEMKLDANRAALEAALALLAGSGADRLIIVALANLADHVLLMGLTHEAVRHAEELVALLRRMRRGGCWPMR
jgi:hypothetical protein